MAVQTRGGAASRAVVVDVQGNGQLPADQPRTLPAGGGTVWVKNGRPKKNFVRLERAVGIMLLFITTTMLYEGHTLVVPYFYTQHGAWACLGMKIFITFVFFQVVCNYLLVKRHPSLYSTTAHTDPGLVLEQHSRLLVESFGQSDNASPLRPVGDDSADALRRETVVLSWRLCVYCNHYAPPRSHHCKICNACVLKRDHHCLITNTCIGFHNQRFFVLMCFYGAVGCLGAFGHGLLFVYREYYETSPVWHHFYPVTIFKWLQGVYSIDRVFIMCHMYVLLPLGIMCFSFFALQLLSLVTGRTLFELTKRLKLRSSSTVQRHLESVFGRRWWLNFLVPAHFLHGQTGDPCAWPNLKIRYSNRGGCQGNSTTTRVLWI